MRLTIFLLLFSLSAQGQFVIDSYRFGAAVAGTLLLDSFPGADLALSLRRVKTSYSSDLITVRRSSNSDTLDVGFLGDYLDTVSLKTFCGTGATDTCFVKRWYDQSGTANHMTQDSAISQPMILINGVVFRDNGEVALNFGRTTDILELPLYASIDVTKNYSIFYTTRVISTSVELLFNVSTNSNSRICISARGRYTLTNTGVTTGKSMTITGLSVLTMENSPQELYRNNVQATSTAVDGAFLSSTLTLGGRPGGSNANCNIFEFIVYPTNQSTNRTAIETNINNFYQIY